MGKTTVLKYCLSNYVCYLDLTAQVANEGGRKESRKRKEKEKREEEGRKDRGMEKNKVKIETVSLQRSREQPGNRTPAKLKGHSQEPAKQNGKAARRRTATAATATTTAE